MALHADVPDPREIFLLHGRDLEALDCMKQFLRALDLRPTSFEDRATELLGSAETLAIVESGMHRAKAIIALITPDEHAVLDPELSNAEDGRMAQERWQPRGNVIHEIGLVMGKDRKKLILLKLSPEVALPSNLDGLNAVYFSGTLRARRDLERRLVAMGCQVTPGADSGWAGDFDGLRHSRRGYAGMPQAPRRSEPARVGSKRDDGRRAGAMKSTFDSFTLPPAAALERTLTSSAERWRRRGIRLAVPLALLAMFFGGEHPRSDVGRAATMFIELGRRIYECYVAGGRLDPLTPQCKPPRPAPAGSDSMSAPPTTAAPR